MFVATLGATILRPFVVEQSIIFTYIGLFNAALTGAVCIFVYRSSPHPSLAVIVIAIAFVEFIPLLLTSGGVNSQFASVIPITPVLACLLTNAKGAWYTFVALLLLIISMAYLDPYLPNYVLEEVSLERTYSRAFWLSMACLISSVFGAEFDRLSRKLGNKLKQQASTDEMTGLANRRSIIEFLQESIDHAKESNAWLTVVMIDIDYFKQINDTYGHVQGDVCLATVSKTLQASVRKNIDAVGRYGGEEFLMVLNEVDSENAAMIAEKVRVAVEKIRFGGKASSLKVSVTLGCFSTRVEEGMVAETFLLVSDEALYVGKNAGRNQIVRA